MAFYPFRSSSSTPVLVYPSGDITGVADAANVNAAILAIIVSGGTVLLAPGTFYFLAGSVTITAPFIYIRGSGRWATIISAVGTGDCLRVYNTNTTGSLTGGGLYDFTIDGTNAGAGSTGLHWGDQRAGELRIGVQNFSAAGSINVHFDNQYAWTEETTGYLWLSNGATNLMFDVSGNNTATNSFGYTELSVEILAKTNQDGVVCNNGALLYNSPGFRVRGNFQGSSSAQTNAVLRITGQVPAGHPNAGSYSAIHSCELSVLAECSNGTGANVPQTIVFGTLGGNSLLGCGGILDFAQGQQAFAVSNWTSLGSTGSFSFSGPIRGDFNLSNATVGTGTGYSFTTQAAQIYGKSLLNIVNGNVSIDEGDFFRAQLAGSITINLNPGAAATFGGAQRKTIMILQASAGGPFTVTWPSNGSPTVNNPTVKWVGGAPTMSAGAGALDLYDLVTYDGAIWVGTAKQNVT